MESPDILGKHNYVRELITNKVITVDFIRSNQNLADHLTKGLTRDLVNKTSRWMSFKPIELNH